ncbi:energy coupling factor transporter S component ThiW [Haloplasma contractile]|uniref:ThiW protein n=1 Tax=Haloplasma contractile SSD-17B TaxID=1033810 RepID=U2FG38_9MOLU|nr:energy coupling factor transporter S component ThiW [Haloplasma contractile]ERJ11860.1 ThiW protein [Haloplasma contractile SSD-17B]
MNKNSIDIKKLVLAALFATIGVVSSPLSLHVGVSKVFPVQHALNIISGIILGPWYAVASAFVTSLIRNMLGTGTPLAFPGSMIGAFLSGYLFLKTKKAFIALLGELIGTGLLGAIVSYPIAKLFLGSEEAALFLFVVPFTLSSLVGVVIGYVIVNVLREANVIEYLNESLKFD